MEIRINYQRNKVVQALRYHFISRKEIKLLLILVNVYALLAAALYAFKIIGAASFLLGSIMWLVLMLVFWFWLPRLVYSRNHTFRDDILLRFREREIELQTSRGIASWPYNRFRYYIETPHFFHLYINDKSFFLIPKESCEPPADSIAVRELLNNKIGRK